MKLSVDFARVTPMDLRYEINPSRLPSSAEILALYKEAGIFFPNWNEDRMDRALTATSLLVCVWHRERLVGVARVISDFAWVAYLTQIAVSPEFQKKGIGTRMIELVKEKLGPEVSLLLHSADTATGFYEAIGFSSYSNVYRIPRSK